MRSFGRVVLTGLVLFALAACGSDGGSSSSSTSSTTKATATSSLDGTQWSLESSDAFDTEGVPVTLEFATGRVSGTSGCNNYGGPFRVQGSNITIGPDLMSTQKACPPPADGVEQRYLAALPTAKRFTVKGETLRLADAGGKAVLEFTRADPAAALLGTWIATGFSTGNAIESVQGDATLTAEFQAKTVNGDSGCNTFNGPYRAGSSDITIGPLASTMRACTDERLSTQERQYLGALQLAKSYRIRGEQLELQRAGGTIAATFERAATG